tara:strand:- start:142 stop:1221 length:1080 start_codon:yes stop_codon:yes gene_type:complete
MIKLKNIKIKSYKPGKSSLGKIKNLIKLSANESALGTSKRVKKIIKDNKLDLSKYPDSKAKELRKVISSKFNCNYNQIICGSGSDEVIEMLCQLILQKGDEVVVPQYSFLMYRIYAAIAGAKIRFSKEYNYKVSIEEIVKKTNKKTRIVFLANPNNPTGTYLNRSELKKLRKKLNKKILLVVDDAYFEYMKDKNYSSGLDIFKKTKNVFILRTFSKIYGLASLRVGWGYGDKKIIDGLYKIKPPFNVTEIAQLAAAESLKDKNFLKKSIDHNFYWANKIKYSLEKFNIKSNIVSGNFLLLNFNKCKMTASLIERKLMLKKILLRETRSYGIKNCLRFTIGDSKQNKLFIKSLNSIFKNV